MSLLRSQHRHISLPHLRLLPPPVMKLAYLLIYSISKTLEITLLGYICLYPAKQACKSFVQNGHLCNEVTKQVT